MPLKIAMIGAGSIEFTRRLMHDVLAVPELIDTTFSLMDISPRNLEMVSQLCQRDIEAIICLQRLSPHLTDAKQLPTPITSFA
jgi:alpha-galactosidase/6-phospho-beta-glucosidase family protein